MIQIIPASQRHQKDFGWLRASWLFSFGDYIDPQNTGWGALRVFNDDAIAWGGFPMHGHRDMEICTLVLSGTLEHEDNLGHRQTLGIGEVQVMSAGSGIRHAERNPSYAELLRLLQIWIEPRQKGLAPRWAQRSFQETIAGQSVATLVCDENMADPHSGPLGIRQNAQIDHLTLAPGQSLVRQPAAGTCSFAYVLAGQGTANGRPITSGDQIRSREEPTITFESSAGMKLLDLQVPETA